MARIISDSDIILDIIKIIIVILVGGAVIWSLASLL